MSRRADFFSGEHRRFSHYCSLDKKTPIAAFPDEVRAMLTGCISKLSWTISAKSLKRIKAMVRTGDGRSQATITAELSADLGRAISLVAPQEQAPTPRRTVFLSHRFAENEYVDGLTRLLEKKGFTASIGSPANTYVSQAVPQRIAEAD
ncbi:MAG: hypothetical protein ACRDTC_02585 [Pseudonocardiaceae bacterium]